jgi:hypothetical protein
MTAVIISRLRFACQAGKRAFWRGQAPPVLGTDMTNKLAAARWFGYEIERARQEANRENGHRRPRP